MYLPRYVYNTLSLSDEPNTGKKKSTYIYVLHLIVLTLTKAGKNNTCGGKKKSIGLKVADAGP